MLMAEGVKHITITTDDPAKYRGVDLPGGVDVVHRDDIVQAQEKLRAMDGSRSTSTTSNARRRSVATANAASSHRRRFG